MTRYILQGNRHMRYKEVSHGVTIAERPNVPTKLPSLSGSRMFV
jgi:hypothetical protein